MHSVAGYNQARVNCGPGSWCPLCHLFSLPISWWFPNTQLSTKKTEVPQQSPWNPEQFHLHRRGAMTSQWLQPQKTKSAETQFLFGKNARWWFQIVFIFNPIWGNDSISHNLTNIFQRGWNHHLECVESWFWLMIDQQFWASNRRSVYSNPGNDSTHLP